ncbi:MAG TPA: hypothetical protein VGP13_00055 [Candidatus Paceibacterota bacterium]|jgi:hypothetical protein|nr:hypothetical protein [Candidatus Paceibacterota bacterium]
MRTFVALCVVAVVLAAASLLADTFRFSYKKDAQVEAVVSFVMATKMSAKDKVTWRVLNLTLTIAGKDEEFEYADKYAMSQELIPGLVFGQKLVCTRTYSTLYGFKSVADCKSR